MKKGIIGFEIYVKYHVLKYLEKERFYSLKKIY